MVSFDVQTFPTRNIFELAPSDGVFDSLIS